jgi:hypothetical protein
MGVVFMVWGVWIRGWDWGEIVNYYGVMLGLGEVFFFRNSGIL